MDDSTTTPAHELTRNPVDGTWGFICREHGIHRAGLTEPHALNVERKHLREDHADAGGPVLDMKTMAANVLMSAAENSSSAGGRLAAWMDLTGLEYAPAMQYAQAVVFTEGPVTAAVVPL